MSGLRRGAIASVIELPGANVTPPPAQRGQIILGGRTTYGNSGNAENAFITSIGGAPANSVLMEYLNLPSTWGTWNTTGVWAAVGGFGTERSMV